MQKYPVRKITQEGNSVENALYLLKWICGNIYHKSDFFNEELKTSVDLLNYSFGKGYACGISCYALSTILTDCCNAVGIVARTIHLHPLSVYDGDSHVVVEIFSEKEKKWIMLDPTYNCYLLDERGKPMGAWELRQALSEGHNVLFNAEIKYNGNTDVDKQELKGYYAKNLFCIKILSKNDMDFDTYSKQTFILAPIGYNAKEAFIENVKFRISQNGDFPFMQKWLNGIKKSNYLNISTASFLAPPHRLIES